MMISSGYERWQIQSRASIYCIQSCDKTIAGLHILNFNSKAIKKSTDVENEMFKLKSNLLQVVHQVSFECEICTC